MWEDTSVRLPQPVDAILMGIVLARSWSAGDDWHLKAVDLLDMRSIVNRHGVKPVDLAQRAADLRCATAVERFLEVCDPWSGRLDLRPPTAWKRQRLYLSILPERGHMGFEKVAIRIRRLPGTLWDIARHLPALWRHRQILRRNPQFSRAVEVSRANAVTPHRNSGTLIDKERTVRGVKWGALLFGGSDPCLLRSLTLFTLFRASNVPMTLWYAQSISRDAVGSVAFHAGIALHDLSMRDLEASSPCRVELATLVNIDARAPVLDGSVQAPSVTTP